MQAPVLAWRRWQEGPLGALCQLHSVHGGQPGGGGAGARAIMLQPRVQHQGPVHVEAEEGGAAQGAGDGGAWGPEPLGHKERATAGACSPQVGVDGGWAGKLSLSLSLSLSLQDLPLHNNKKR